MNLIVLAPASSAFCRSSYEQESINTLTKFTIEVIPFKIWHHDIKRSRLSISERYTILIIVLHQTVIRIIIFYQQTAVPITSGSRTSETGGQIFAVIFEQPFFWRFLKKMSTFPLKIVI